MAVTTDHETITAHTQRAKNRRSVNPPTRATETATRTSNDHNRVDRSERDGRVGSSAWSSSRATMSHFSLPDNIRETFRQWSAGVEAGGSFQPPQSDPATMSPGGSSLSTDWCHSIVGCLLSSVLVGFFFRQGDFS